MTPANALQQLFRSDYAIPDPGNGGTIRCDRQYGVVEMTSGAGAGTRTLVGPSRPGLRLLLRLKTDGGGDLTVTAAEGFNVAGNDTAVFADAGDQLDMISVTGSNRWEVLTNTGSVSLDTAGTTAAPTTAAPTTLAPTTAAPTTAAPTTAAPTTLAPTTLAPTTAAPTTAAPTT